MFNVTNADSIISPLVFPGYQLNVSATANTNVTINVRALAWPATLAVLSPNPQAAQPLTSNAPAYGRNCFVVGRTENMTRDSVSEKTPNFFMRDSPRGLC